MARISGLSKQIADMALLLMKEGTDPDVALNSAARLSDATPEQVAFADDLIKRRAVALENLGGYDRNKSFVMPANKLIAARQMIGDYTFKPNMMSGARIALRGENKALVSGTEIVPEGTRGPFRISRTPRMLAFSRMEGADAAETRLRAELALAASEGNVEKMQLILQDLGFTPDYAYNLAVRTIGR
jgi:hypothetical protein